jgi:hypothetical protein
MNYEKTFPVVVTMRVACRCEQAENETYEFGMPADKGEPMEEYQPGTTQSAGRRSGSICAG